MPSPLKLLLVEDDPLDAELLLDAVANAGFTVTAERTDTEAGFLVALAREWDLVLSDWVIPGFGALRALELLMEQRPEVPFIVVSGTVGEETAVAALKRGALDYLLKGKLTRLGSAIAHALEQSRLRRERAEAEQRLRLSEERFRQVVENIHEVFWLANLVTGEILYLSPRFEEIWGRAGVADPATLHDLVKTVHPDDRARIQEVIARLADKKYDETFRVIRPDGAIRWVRARTYPVRDQNGPADRVVSVIEDVTEHKQLEARFLRAQRLEAVGTLAGGMAHDLNNILSPMLMAAELLKETAPNDRERDMLAMIERSAQRGADIIRQLLTFSRGIEGERQPVQLKHLAREMSHIIRETFPRDINLTEHVPNDLWPVIADPTQMHQVMVNLCVNARDAMPRGGTLTLAVRNTALDEAMAASRPEAQPGRYVVLSVADTGTGMTPEVIDHIFEPFFTTKGVGKGTGLGLSTVQGIVRSHGGFLEVTSELGQGSTFEVYLLAAAMLEGAAKIAAPARPPVGNGQMVLVVDDEPPVRAAMQHALERANYRVVTAANGREGIVMYLRHRDSIRLVITDAMMPEMGGAALVRALRGLDRHLKFVALSGLDSEHEDLRAVGVTTVVAKPCGQQALLEAMQRELAPA